LLKNYEKRIFKLQNYKNLAFFLFFRSASGKLARVCWVFRLEMIKK